ncbi:hypothetical protein L2E82_30667 [Cichorium intybus]|uniref:Uncharacterized protein n=1 Tax=Cichorium intybus TaxID=13427 RepID=A0ACB9D0W7_CICIN|nr:hypothetical protein L2E82_30667 [Cichorium intybus]
MVVHLLFSHRSPLPSTSHSRFVSTSHGFCLAAQHGQSDKEDGPLDECKRVSTESQNLKLDISNKFHGAIKDVTNKLEEQRDGRLTQLKENEMLRTLLKQKEEHNALNIQQYTQQLKQKSLELQIADLKTQQHEEKLVKEQSQMKMYAEQVSQLLATEKNLRLQLTADGEKFQQFQDPLVKSNEVFETFKQEIEMRERMKKQLEKSKNQKEM